MRFFYISVYSVLLQVSAVHHFRLKLIEGKKQYQINTIHLCLSDNNNNNNKLPYSLNCFIIPTSAQFFLTH